MSMVERIARAPWFPELENLSHKHRLLAFIIHARTEEVAVSSNPDIPHDHIAIPIRWSGRMNVYYPGEINRNPLSLEGWNLSILLDPDETRNENWFIAIALCHPVIKDFIEHRLPLILAYRQMSQAERQEVKALRSTLPNRTTWLTNNIIYYTPESWKKRLSSTH